MNIEQIPNIEHCTVTPLINGGIILAYTVTTHEGWYIRKNTWTDELANMWKTATMIYPDEDFTQIQIVAEADLPPGYEINNETTQPEIQQESSEVSNDNC